MLTHLAFLVLLGQCQKNIKKLHDETSIKQNPEQEKISRKDAKERQDAKKRCKSAKAPFKKVEHLELRYIILYDKGYPIKQREAS